MGRPCLKRRKAQIHHDIFRTVLHSAIHSWAIAIDLIENKLLTGGNLETPDRGLLK